VSIDSSAVLLYGMKIQPPDTQGESQTEYIDRVLHESALSPIGHAHIGPWGHEEFYLCTAYYSSELGEVAFLALQYDAETCAHWDGVLNAAARALGITTHDAPNWLLLAVQS
jgi:hypothetical protein